MDLVQLHVPSVGHAGSQPSLKVVLINPPVMDPSCPYGSLYHLKSYVDSRSRHHAVVRDLNIEWLDYLFTPPMVARLYADVDARRRVIESSDAISLIDQAAYYRLLPTGFFVRCVVPG